MARKPLMVCIHCGGMPFNGDTIPSGKSLGGSESAAYFMAKELAKLGHKVVVFTNMSKPGRWDDVIYDFIGNVTEQAPLGERFHYSMQVPWDAVIIQRHPMAFSRQINSKCNIWWLHDLALHRFAPVVDRQLPFVDQVFTVSEFHREQVSKIYGIDKEFITPTHNGVDYSLFEKLRKNPPARERKSLVFASRPERGLQELVGEGGIMELLPDFDLSVCGYDNTTPQMEGLYNYLWSRCEQFPNVKNYGPLGKADLYQLLARSGAYVYPTTFEDTSNIMLLESNAVGTPFICPVDHAALPETGRDAGMVTVPLADGNIDPKAFADTIRSFLNNDSAWEKMHKRALEKHQDWSSAALQWEAEIYRILGEKSSNTVRLTKHLEHMSDIAAILHLHKNDITSIKKVLPDFSKNYGFFLNDKFKDHYDAYYEYEENRGANYGPENLGNNARFEHTFNVIKELKPKTILDYGCAHGHYVMNILHRAPQFKITGVDINQLNIEKARAWAEKDNPQIAPEFICGTVADIPEDAKFDCIIAAEVLEHVADPAALIESLKAHLQPQGYIIITTPYGPWEAIGYEQHKGWRAHLHHFERWDLFDLFAEQPEYKVIAIPHDFDLGHHLVHFKAGGPPCGKVDYERKLTTQAPRETVSLCMIAKDSELTIGKTLDKLRGLADEVIVVVDEKSTDATGAIAKSFGATVLAGKHVLDIGFAAARNLSIEKASCDWILWVDADEHFERVENVHKFLRRSPVMGLGVPQHHLAEEPVGVLKTDYPCRLFRNHRGVQFFGFVHEHPEVKINEGVGKVFLAEDFGIMHFGYATEAIRRKRFERNWPLIQRDQKENPDRVLGIFLWMRDLAHMCKYLQERSGGAMTPNVAKFAELAIETWDKVLATKNLRMIGDGLQFYSEAVHHLTNGNGIEYSIDLKSRKGGLSPMLPTFKGYFLNSKAIEKFSEIVNSEATKIYDERYF